MGFGVYINKQQRQTKMNDRNINIVATKYRQERLGGLLKIGKAQVIGIVKPDRKEKENEKEYYLVVDLVKEETWLVLVEDKPKWRKYVSK